MDDDDYMEEIGLHLMQSNSTCRADRGKNWIFLEKGTCGRPEEYGAGARISAEKEKKKRFNVGLLAHVLPTYT